MILKQKNLCSPRMQVGVGLLEMKVMMEQWGLQLPMKRLVLLLDFLSLLSNYHNGMAYMFLRSLGCTRVYHYGC